jgi:hypothetical protein
MTETTIVQVDALGPNGAYRSRNRMAISDVAGHPMAELSLVPRLFVTRTMAALRSATTMTADDRVAALTRAAGIFAAGVVDGMSAEDYQLAVSRVSGMAISVVRGSMWGTAEGARQAYRCAELGRPAGAAGDWRDPVTRTERAV